MPAPANAIFTHSDERGTVGWLPHPGLTDSLCNDLTVAVGWNPRAWPFLPEDCELFHQLEHALLACKAIPSPQGFVSSRDRGRRWYGRIIGASTIVPRQETSASCQRVSREIRMTSRKSPVIGNVSSAHAVCTNRRGTRRPRMPVSPAVRLSSMSAFFSS
jgi:hypothetical protein